MSGGDVRVCMFCGARRLTKTHLIAQRAIRRFLPTTGVGVEKSDIWIDPNSGPQFRTQNYHLDPLSQQVKRACEPCNRDWMGGIENDVASTVIDLAKGDPRALAADDAERLAVWATAVAMLRTTQDPGEPTFAAADARVLRQTSMLPPGYVVWLLRGETRWDFPSRHQRILIAMGGDPYMPTHVTWFWIGQSVYLINHPSAAPALSRLNVFGDAVQILAPYGDYPVGWPFRASVAHSSMVELTDTFYRS